MFYKVFLTCIALLQFGKFLYAEDIIDKIDPLMLINDKPNINTISSSVCTIIENKKELDIDDLISIALCRNHGIKSSWSSLLATQAMAGGLSGTYLPSVGFSVGDRYTAVNGLALGGGGGSKISTNTSVVSATLDWLLYDFGARAAGLRALKHNLESIGYGHSALIENIIFNILNKYYTYLIAQKLLVSKINAEEFARTNLEYNKIRKASGIGRKLEELQASAFHSKTKLALKAAQQEAITAKNDLLLSLGFDISETDSVNILDTMQDDNKYVKKTINADIKILLEKAKSSHSLKAADANIEAEKINIERLTLDLLPKLSLSGSYNKIDSFLYYSGQPMNIDYSLIGVQLSIPIFSGFQNIYNIKQARYKYMASVEHKKTLEENISIEVWRAYNDFILSSDSIELADNLYKSASEAASHAKIGYKNGASSILELLSTQSAMLEAEDAQISSKYRHYIAKLNLLRIINGLLRE